MKEIDMRTDDLFVSVASPQPEGAHRREAARIRALASSVTTPAMRRHLEDRARAHEWLAGRRDEPG
jgi:hypothetical protein